jgi:hypothetical protein
MHHLNPITSLALTAFFCAHTSSHAQSARPVAWWTFDEPSDQEVLDQAGKHRDRLDGRYTVVDGVRGKAIRFDSFTTEITRAAAKAPALSGGFAVEGHVAFGAYPWNWCALITQRDEEAAGFSVDIGPRGELRLQLKVGDQWLSCTSPVQSIPLWQWTHLAASYDPATGIALVANGKAVAQLAATGEPVFAKHIDLKIGTNHTIGKPSDVHREYGTLPQFFSLDGILDELRLYNQAISPAQVALNHSANPAPAKPDLPPRRLPSGPQGPARFGAFYQHLEYYPEWDALWPVADDPDIVVRFDSSPARMVFWRGTRYSPAWVSGNGLWMADQSVEAWDDKEGCFEHMQDRRCRYSHVRIIESNEARVVVHWRYAPTSAHNNLWREDPKTGRACWVDEYYYVYPDVAAVRNVSWVAGTLGKPQQFQESLPLTHPGQYPHEVVEPAWVSIANHKGDTGELRFVEKPAKEPRKDIPENPTIQRYNFKSAQKPFICFEPGNRMRYLMDRNISALNRPGSCNHWPVGQAICDGNTAQTSDRPTHFCGFPISTPPQHRVGNRLHWYGLYGMTEGGMDELVRLNRSWSTPAALSLGNDTLSGGSYERGQRAYLLKREAQSGAAEFTLAGSTESPVINPALVIENWGEEAVRIEINGKPLVQGADCRIGKRDRLEGSDLIVWLKLQSDAPVRIRLVPTP